MSDPYQVVRDPTVDEQVWLADTASGLHLRVVPRPEFTQTAAVISFGYGSTDLGFVADGDTVRTPEGTAHYLEHKLFEDEELQAFDRFARRGAQVNAMTGFTRTTYFFTATSQIEENLADLLHLVSHAHITPENVDKERGIIAQEVKMYEDSPEFCTLFDLLGCLYGEHPVRHTVGGTVESIQGITADALLQCYRAFYRTGNAALAVAGPVDPERIFALAEACPLPTGATPESLCPEDLGPPPNPRTRRTMQVARTKVLLGVKDRSLAVDAEARLRRQMVTRVLLERLFAGSSEIREELHRRGVVDDSLSTGYHGERTFGFTVVGCETDDPDPVIEELRNVLLKPVVLDQDHLERIKRRSLGQYVRSFESVRSMAFGHGQEALERVPPFEALRRLASITLDEVEERRQELFTADNLAVAVTEAG